MDFRDHNFSWLRSFACFLFFIFHLEIRGFPWTVIHLTRGRLAPRSHTVSYMKVQAVANLRWIIKNPPTVKSMMICFFERNQQMAEAAGCATLPRFLFHHHLGSKLTEEPVASWKTLKSCPVFSGRNQQQRAAPRPPLPGQDSHSGLHFPHARRVSAGVMRYLAERDGELPSQEESTAATRLWTDTLPPNAILPSSPLLYLSPGGIKRENDWWRDGVKTGDMLIQLIKSSPGPQRRGCPVTHMTTHTGKLAGTLLKKPQINTFD